MNLPPLPKKGVMAYTEDGSGKIYGYTSHAMYEYAKLAVKLALEEAAPLFSTSPKLVPLRKTLPDCNYCGAKVIYCVEEHDAKLNMDRLRAFCHTCRSTWLVPLEVEEHLNP